MFHRLRQLLKLFVPPVLVDLVRGRLNLPPGYTWEGIYPHRRDVPVRHASYDHEARISEMAAQGRDLLGQVRAGQRPGLWHDTLALVAATVSAGSGRLRVVDFGGAMGTGFIQLIATLPPTTALEYHVVDLPGMCAAGREVFASEPRIRFHTTLAEVPAEPDIVYVNSVLQYIDDYASQLRALAALRAPRLLLARTAIGDFPTFATRQLNLPGQVLAYWFLNQDEVLGVLAGAGYRLAFESLGDREYDQTNFPVTHRIGRMRNLLFVHG